jgi:hypothetical protein
MMNNNEEMLGFDIIPIIDGGGEDDGEKTFSLPEVNLESIRQIKPQAAYLMISQFSTFFRGERIPCERWISVLQAIPQHIIGLSLDGAFFGKDFTTEEIIQILRAIPQHIKGLDFVDNSLSLKNNPGEISSILAAMPANLMHLDLACNNLGDLPGQELITAFTQKNLLNLKYLRLSNNNLHNLSNDDLCQLAIALPENIDDLDLCNNNLENKENTELSKIFNSFKSNIKEIVCLSLQPSLQVNGLFFNFNTYKLVRSENFNKEVFFNKTKAFLQKITDLSNNIKTAPRLKITEGQAFEMLFKFLTSIDVSRLARVCKEKPSLTM